MPVKVKRDVTKTYSHKHRLYVNRKVSTMTHFYKYGQIEHFNGDVVSGDINIKYRGLTYSIAVINNHLLIHYSSTNVGGSRYFTTSESYNKSYKSELLHPFDKELEIEKVIEILKVRTDKKLVNSLMELANYILEWHLVKERWTFKIDRE